MTTNLAIDDELLEQARKLGKQKSKLETVSAALKEYVQRRKRLRALKGFATITFDPKFDHKRARTKR
jgi:Arc/MetJ family transcription regulator